MDAMIRRVKKETPDTFRACQVSLPGVSNVVLDIRKKGRETCPGKCRKSWKHPLVRASLVYIKNWKTCIFNKVQSLKMRKFIP